MRAAIIGLGKIAWRHDGGQPIDGAVLTHLSALLNAGIDVVGGADPCPQARRDFTISTGIVAYSTVAELLDKAPDLVTIASPNRFHAQHLTACLDVGVKYIWLEKPATTDLTATRALAIRARAQGARVMVGFQRRYMPSYQKLKQNDLGALSGIDVTYSRGLETNGSHMVDLILWLLGDRIPSLIGVVPSSALATDITEQCPSFLLQGVGNVPVTVTGLDLDYHSIDIVVHYSTGRRSVRHGGQTALTEVKTPNPMFAGFYYLHSVHGSQNVQNEVGKVFPVMLQDLLFGDEDQPLSNLDSAVLGQSIVAQVLDTCV